MPYSAAAVFDLVPFWVLPRTCAADDTLGAISLSGVLVGQGVTGAILRREPPETRCSIG